MKNTIYLDCGMGAAGDMLTAALFELCSDRDKALEGLNHLGIPGIEFRAQKAEKCGITGLRAGRGEYGCASGWSRA